MADALLLDVPVGATPVEGEGSALGTRLQLGQWLRPPGQQRGVLLRPALVRRNPAAVCVEQQPRGQRRLLQALQLLQAFGEDEIQLQFAQQLDLCGRRFQRIEQRRHPAQPLRGQRRQQRLGARPAEDRQGRAVGEAARLQSAGQRAHLGGDLRPAAHLPDAQALVAQGNARALLARLPLQPLGQAGGDALPAVGELNHVPSRP
ncbi:hypothetical protein D3C78_1057080 [compost metagenome]